MAKLTRLRGPRRISPSGHVVEVMIYAAPREKTGDQDLAFLASLSGAETLSISDLPLTRHATDVLPTLKQLQRLQISGNCIRNEHLAVVGKMQQLRELRLDGTGLSASGMAPLANLRHLKVLVMYGAESTTRPCPPSQA